MTDQPFDAGVEFDRQVGDLLAKDYPALAGLSPEEFSARLTPLRATVTRRAATMVPPTEGRVPFVLVVTRELVPVEERLTRLTLAGKRKPGFLDRHYAEGDLARFDPIKELELPDASAYLLFDVDRGEETLNLAPDAAMEVITGQDRTPLTIDEGISFVTHFPAALAKNKCFSLVGSRCGDRRVPALWISQGAPKLGWCWYGNPHTWLGSASAADRSA
ncbi:DUF5701 family protein [Micromonospora sp. CPCC 206060]|uniref:DUF5701 family protein n=1 Tax=Micromonospora sp. CPCC 206060 TaxID=3122406 RepID=UPI002FF2814A